MKKFFLLGRILRVAACTACALGILLQWSPIVTVVLLVVTAVSWSVVGYCEGLEDGRELS